MVDPHSWLKQRDPHRRTIVLTALMGAILLLGFLCHPPEGLGLATSHTHLGQSGVEHCWTVIATLPTMGFVPILVTLLSATLLPHMSLRVASPFKPPRAS